MTRPLVTVIAALTLREFVRRRIVWVLLALAVISVVLVGWGVERLVTLAREEGAAELEIRIGVSQVLILIAFMFSFVLAMSAAFLAAPAIARRRDRHRPRDACPPDAPRRPGRRALAGPVDRGRRLRGPVRPVRHGGGRPRERPLRRRNRSSRSRSSPSRR
jgi:hypothetical protein